MSLYLGIDSGTQSTKGVALDLGRGRVVAEARAPHRLIPGLPEGHAEQHPQDWAAALDTVLDALAAQVDRAQVRGIGVSGQQHGFVPLDAERRVIRPAKLWCDTSTAAECALLTRRLGGPAAVLRETGLPFLPGYTAPKVLWLKRREPAHFRRLRHILLPHDFLNLHLTGELTMEAGDASGTALLDVRRRRWSERACAAIDARVRDCLPELGAPGRPAGMLRPDLARRWGFPGDVVVSAGGGDNMMGAIGTGNVAPGVVTASFGTSGTVYAYSRRPVVDPQGEIAAFCDSTGGWLPLLCTMNVTLVTEHFRTLAGLDHAGMERALEKTPPGADGLVLLPYLDGERTPNLPGGRGNLFGLTRRNGSPAHLVRAAVEGVTLGMDQGLRRLAALGVRAREVRVTGGGAKSAAWRQVMADIFGVPVVKMVEDEGAALGGALQAAWVDARARGGRTTLPELCARAVAVDEPSRREPAPASRAACRDLRERYATLGTALRPLLG
jgi:xylulokinase